MVTAAPGGPATQSSPEREWTATAQVNSIFGGGGFGGYHWTSLMPKNTIASSRIAAANSSLEANRRGIWSVFLSTRETTQQPFQAELGITFGELLFDDSFLQFVR